MNSTTDHRQGGVTWLLTVIGPGIVVAGSVMGSGELINTPVQAAKFGFVLLWVVLLSCVIKYFLQVEIGAQYLSRSQVPSGFVDWDHLYVWLSGLLSDTSRHDRCTGRHDA
jgi:amino acid permease